MPMGMKKNDSIAIIGRVADGVELYDGQTVTTRILRDELQKRIVGANIYCVDTYQYKKHLLKCFFQTVKALFCCPHIFILLSKNGRSFYFPFLYYANKLFHRRIYHRLIGGSLGDTVKKHPAQVKYLNSFYVNWVEGTAQLKKLRECGVINADEIYTYRGNEIVQSEDFPLYTRPPFRFCTFCRVTKDKGISTAIQAVIDVNQQRGRISLLDIYGPLEDSYQQEFESMIRKSDGAVRYMGSVPSQKSVETLKQYFVHLFPTTWEGEGMPGTLVDALSAGLPTIATDWNYNAEILTEGVTGFCYDWRHPEYLTEKMLYVIDHPQRVMDMRDACIKEARKYTPDIVMNQIISKMQE